MDRINKLFEILTVVRDFEYIEHLQLQMLNVSKLQSAIECSSDFTPDAKWNIILTEMTAN